MYVSALVKQQLRLCCNRLSFRSWRNSIYTASTCTQRMTLHCSTAAAVSSVGSYCSHPESLTHACALTLHLLLSSAMCAQCALHAIQTGWCVCNSWSAWYAQTRLQCLL